MNPGDIVLYRSGGPLSALARLAQRAPVAHAAIVAADGKHVIAAEGNGVRLELAPDPDRPDIWLYPFPDAIRNVTAANAAASQIGSAYDYRAYLGLAARALFAVTPPTSLRPHLFICSALCCWAWRQAGIDPCPGQPTRTVTPGDLFDRLARVPAALERAA